jgi:hypothetical protein
LLSIQTCVITAVVEIQSLPTCVESHDGLLSLQILQLHASIFIGRRIQCVLVSDAVQRPPRFALFASLQKLIGLFQKLSRLLSLNLSLST